MRRLAWVEAALWGQRGHLFPWAPVCVAGGIGSYFSLRVEPGLTVYAVLAGLAAFLILCARRWPGAFSPLLAGLALIAVGFSLAAARTHLVAAPKLQFRYYGPIEGRVVALDRSGSDMPRVTLDQVILAKTDPARLPGRVRLSVHGDPRELIPGERIMTTGHLSPPPGPAEPGGFDFRRHAWFLGLGAVGYTRNPVMRVSAPSGAISVFSLRMSLSEAMRAYLPGDTGGFAAAVTTGDRSGVSLGTMDALRASNLAHLLAISGLHMGLLAGVVFGALRLGFALSPFVALRWPTKKVAAIGAICAAAIYLLLSGGSVATQRAFVMAAVALTAVVFDRRALSLRAVAMAALVVLALRPDSLLSPGFQMSFAATTALVAVFTTLRGVERAWLPKWANPVAGVVISSAVAGLATAPVAAAHFNAVAQYGLIANLVSVPVMGILVIPAAVAAACLAPFGLAGPALTIMGWGLDWILWVAHQVASWPDARVAVVAPGPDVLPLLSLGVLFVILWQGRARWLGVLPAAAAFVMWSGTGRPDALVADAGTLVGVMTEQGRALSKPRGAGFVAKVWLENDGDLSAQAAAAERWPKQEGYLRSYDLSGATLLHLSGKRAAAAFQGCAPGDIVVASTELRGDCNIFTPERLRATGSLALYADPAGLRIVTAREVSGDRLWNAREQARLKLAWLYR